MKSKPKFKKDKCKRCNDETLLLKVPYYGLLCGECIEGFIDRVLFPAAASTDITDIDESFRNKIYDESLGDTDF